eukprot:GFYU01013478.1.p1 GENE.GFYU01013478.1~~GFYU01013478.1.p1  ORF type:complete len:247 (-),score=1.14 GFYU01013478.1:53-793(-)
MSISSIPRLEDLQTGGNLSRASCWWYSRHGLHLRKKMDPYFLGPSNGVPSKAAPKFIGLSTPRRNERTLSPTGFHKGFRESRESRVRSLTHIPRLPIPENRFDSDEDTPHLGPMATPVDVDLEDEDAPFFITQTKRPRTQQSDTPRRRYMRVVKRKEVKRPSTATHPTRRQHLDYDDELSPRDLSPPRVPVLDLNWVPGKHIPGKPERNRTPRTAAGFMTHRPPRPERDGLISPMLTSSWSRTPRF